MFIRPEDLRHTVKIAKLAGVVERLQGSRLSAGERPKASLIVDPPLAVRLYDDEPVCPFHSREGYAISRIHLAVGL